LVAHLPAMSGGSNLSTYLNEIQKYPILAADEEFMLACRWRDHADAEAARRLITSHLRLVAKIALGYRGYGLPLEDVIAEGNVGLMQAVKRFDPDRGFRLSTYAMWWVRASIQEFILRSWSLVKMGTTAAQKKLFFNLRRLKNQMNAIEAGDLPPEVVKKIATELDVGEHEVVEMNRRFAGPDQSLNAPVSAEGDAEWQDWLTDSRPSQETTVAENEEQTKRMSLMQSALEDLNERERHIFTERCLKEPAATLEDLAQVYGISRERVRQIEVRAFEKVQKKTLDLAIADGVVNEQQILAARASGGHRQLRGSNQPN